MTILTVLFSFFCIYITGFSFLNLFPKLRKLHFFQKIGYSYGLGIGMLTLTMFCYSILRIQWSPIYILLPYVLIWYYSHKANAYLSKIRLQKFLINKTYILFLVLILLTVFYVLFEAMLRPLSAWDAWATWFFAGKAFYIQGFMNPEVYKYGHFDNPPLTQLLVTFSYILLGKENDTISLLYFFHFYFNIILLFFITLKRYTTTNFSLLFTFLLATLPVIVRQAGRFDIGYADLPLSYFIFCSILFFNKYTKHQSLVYLCLLELFLGFGSIVKNEGGTFLIVMQILILITLFYKKVFSRETFSIFFFGFIPFFGWWIYKNYYDIPLIYLAKGVFHIERFFNILERVIYEFINIQRWNLVWPIFFILLLYTLLKKDYKNSFMLIPIFVQFLVYIFIYFITPVGIEQINGTLDRLLLHLIPVIMLWIGMTSYNYLFKGLFLNKN